MTVLAVLTVQPVDIVETENTVVTVEIVETEETVLIEDLKKYELPKNSVVLLTANMDTRDASASKKDGVPQQICYASYPKTKCLFTQGTVQSPQFQQAVSMFSMALQSGQIAPLVN